MKPRAGIAAALTRAADDLTDDIGRQRFAAPVAYVYNPLVYARALHLQYLERFAGEKEIVFLGMNPGPYGMAQTGIPFGEVAVVRDWLRLDGKIETPKRVHPKRPIEGLACPRSEVSGKRLWGLFMDRFGTPARFFDKHFVLNYCPLAFMEESGKNLTPDKLPANEARRLYDACDRHLATVIDTIRPSWVIGVGAFAAARAEAVAKDCVRVGQILHPSPASPAANRGWAEAATRQLKDLGIWC